MKYAIANVTIGSSRITTAPTISPRRTHIQLTCFSHSQSRRCAQPGSGGLRRGGPFGGPLGGGLPHGGC